MNKEIIKRKIIKFLDGEDGKALTEIGEYLKEKGLIKADEIYRELHKILWELEDEGLLEERHFREDANFRVDYSLEPLYYRQKGRLKAFNRSLSESVSEKEKEKFEGQIKEIKDKYLLE